jgi:SAM-dependent methyltransferase
MMDWHRRQWEDLGRRDPYWAVLSHPGKRGGRWDPTAFFATGEAEIADVVTRLAVLDVAWRPGTALDFGCGVGRLSRALARRFARVLAVDHAASMLDEARAANADLANIEYLHDDGAPLAAVADGCVDFLYSSHTLQHMPPARQLACLAAFARVLRPGAALVFQTPSRHDLGTPRGWLHFLCGNRVLNPVRRVARGGGGVMELHCLPRRDVLAALRNVGLTVCGSDRDAAAGAGFVSNRYVALKTHDGGEE